MITETSTDGAGTGSTAPRPAARQASGDASGARPISPGAGSPPTRTAADGTATGASDGVMATSASASGSSPASPSAASAMPTVSSTRASATGITSVAASFAPNAAPKPRRAAPSAAGSSGRSTT